MHLSKEAKAEWERMATVLHEHGLLTEVNRDALAAYCEAFAQWLKAANAEPAAGADERQAMSEMRGLADDLGLTPSGRSRATRVDAEGGADAEASQEEDRSRD